MLCDDGCVRHRLGAVWGAGAKDDLEESGWKMVSGDVFRSPSDAVLLCVQVGSGVQIITSATLTLFFAALGTQSTPCSLPPLSRFTLMLSCQGS